MKVLILSAKDDNGGIGIAIKRAFDKHSTDITVRSVTREDNFIGWEKDVYWPYGFDTEAVDALFREADVIHIMDLFAAAEHFPGYASKAKVFHHHGYDFRQNPQHLMARCRREGIRQIVATPDLLRYGHDLTWLPNPCDIDLMQSIRLRNRTTGSRVRIVQTPSGRDKNGTDAFIAGMNALPRHLTASTDLDIIENLPWDQCMARKARGDVMFDSFNVGYGISTIEAWGMGIPVIHGGDEQTEDAVYEQVGFTPYYYANPDTIGAALEAMVADPELREEYREKGWQAVNEQHSEEVVVQRLTAIYEEAMG